MRVSLEFEARRAMAMLDTMAGRAVNLQPAGEQILGDLRRLSARQFATAGAARGPAWAPLKPATVRRKAASKDARIRANAQRPLVATGAMRRSLTSKSGASRATADEVVFASPLVRARYHHHGVPSRNLPARPLIRLDERDLARHARIVIAHVTGALDPISRRTRGEAA